jgi:hypothetical protein
VEGNTNGEEICHYGSQMASAENLDFPFSFFGTLYNMLYINSSGSLSFREPNFSFSSVGFPEAPYFDVVAPFWAYVDTTEKTGRIWKKKLPGNAFAVAWDHVGYSDRQGDLRDTFQVVISDGNNPEMGLGNNVCFCYEDMQWTTGGKKTSTCCRWPKICPLHWYFSDVVFFLLLGSSGGVGGFGGIPATVGANQGNGVDYIQIGQYDAPGTGPQGIDNLDNQAYCFPLPPAANDPPVVGNAPPGKQIDLVCDEALVDYTLTFAAPESYQKVSLVVSGESGGLEVDYGDDSQTAFATLNWVPSYAATVYLTFTASDNAGGVTTITVTVNSQGPCPRVCTYCDFSNLTVFPNSAIDGKVDWYYDEGNLFYTLNGQALLDSCGLKVDAGDSLFITVLDSQSPRRNTTRSRFDPDLGSPNLSCGGVGRGKGGEKGQPWENCEPLGNVLIRQNWRYKDPNDDPSGGCMNFEFASTKATNISFGLLDIESSEPADIFVRTFEWNHDVFLNVSSYRADDSVLVSKIACMFTQLYNASGTIGQFQAARNIGNNGYWTTDSPKNTDPALAGIAAAVQVDQMSVCFSGSAALTHINYCLSDY